MKKLVFVLSFLTLAVCASSSYRLELDTQPTLSTTADIFAECIVVNEKEYCVLYSLGYLGYYNDKNTPDMDKFLDKHKDLFTGKEFELVARVHRFYKTMIDDKSFSLDEAKYICVLAGAIGALYYAETIEKDLTVNQASDWAELTCETGVAPFNISMFALDKLSYLQRF